MTIEFTAPTGLTGTLTGTPLQVALTWDASTFITGASLLLHFDGTAGSTSFPDTSGNGYTVTSVSGAALEVSEVMFGSAALAAGSGYATVPITAAGPLDLSTGDFTVEFWVYLTGVADDQLFLDYGTNNATSGGFWLENESFSGDNITFNYWTGTGYQSGTSVAGLSQNTWYAVSIVRQGNNVSLYVNGVVASNSPSTVPTNLAIGGDVNIGGGFRVSNPGYIDEFRITKGTALYTGNYTPSVVPFADDSTAPYGYDIWRDGSSLAQVVGATFSYDDTVPSPASYSYTVYAWDGTNDVSLVSNTAVVNVTTAVVPNLFNVSLTPVAMELLAAQGLLVGSVTYQPSGVIIAGNIISQSPAGGTTAIVGTPVDVVVSSGLPTPTVPDLFGLTQAEAVTLLESLGLAVGAIGSAPSQFVGVGEVQSQNPSAGASVALGTVVSFVLSAGVPVVGTLFDFEATVISQYANSPTIMQLCNNLNQYVDQSQNFANFFNYVWNVLTAVGFGLDIWGAIVDVGRLLQISNSTEYVGFYMPSESQPDQDYTPMGSDQDNPPIGGAMYTGYDATQAYLLPDDAYRQLILAKAFANICATTAPAVNQILQNLYGAGTAYVLNTGPMAISYNLTFTPTPTQLAILEQSGVIPTPPGVAVTINTGV